MSDLKPIPISTATTAWELCEDVKRAIAEEPARANMSVFAKPRLPDQGGPACGTVGCVAGWICLLRGGIGAEQIKTRASIHAEQILGDGVDYHTVPAEDDDEEFADPDLTYVFNSGEGDDCFTTDPGTQEHADAVIARIDHFMAVNADKLKAKQLEPITK